MHYEPKALYIARNNMRDRDQRYNRFQYTPRSRYSTLLNALQYIQSTLDKSVVFRCSCFHGSCGTCGVTVNGRPVLACLTLLDTIKERNIYIDPLTAFPVIKDVAVNLQSLFEHLPSDATYLRSAELHANTRARPRRLENCIECGLCEAACPVTRDFIGPAALSARYREIINRPHRKEQMLSEVAQDNGVAACQNHHQCSKVCPAGVYPAADIIKLRTMLEG